MKAKYQEQTKSLLDVLPIVGRYPDFALKGGTALNYLNTKAYVPGKKGPGSISLFQRMYAGVSRGRN